MIIKVFADHNLGSTQVWEILLFHLEAQLKADCAFERHELLHITSALKHRQVRHKEIWAWLMKAMVQLLNRRQFNCKDICQLSYDLYSVKITQPAIYQFFVKYFQLMGFTS